MRVRHNVVYIFNEYDRSLNIVQVLDKCTVTTRAEQQFAIRRAERCAVRIGCQGVSRRFLLGEGDVELNPILRLEFLQIVGYMLAEEWQMVVRDGEVDVYLAIRGSI